MGAPKTPGTSRSRLDYIDYAKGIGIMLVVLGHTNLVTDTDDMFANSIGKAIYSFHMPLFFILTGMVTGLAEKAHKDKPAHLDVKKLFFRLMIPYYFWSAAYSSVSALYFILKKRPVYDSLNLNIRVTLTACGKAPLWFLAALFFARLVFHLLRYRLNIDARIIIVSTAVLSQAANICFVHFDIGSLPDESLLREVMIAVFRLLPSLFFIAAGNYAAKFINSEKKLQNAGAGTVLFAVLLISLHFYAPSINMHLFRYDNLLYSLYTGLVGSFALILICLALPGGIRPLSQLGIASMEIMLLHYNPLPFMALSARITERLTGGRNMIIIWLTACTMAIPSAIVLRHTKKYLSCRMKHRQTDT